MSIDLSNISPTVVIAILGFALMGVVEFVKSVFDAFDRRQEDKSFRKPVIILVSAFAGWVLIPIFGNFFTGLTAGQLQIVGVVMGFANSGAVTLAFEWGKKAKGATTTVSVPATPGEFETDEPVI